MTDDGSRIAIVLPPAEDSAASVVLRTLTKTLMDAGHETSGGLLGGEYGYGAYFENDTFMMHPYCWCEQDDCPWCLACTCPDDAYEYHVNGKPVDFEVWVEAENRTPIISIPEKQCAKCRGEVQPAPNFLHKPSGTTVYWYKYIGRGMAITGRESWNRILSDCLRSLNA